MSPDAGAARVLHLLARDGWGGTELQVSTAVMSGDRDRLDQEVAILDRPGVMSERLGDAGVAVTSLAGPGGPLGAAWRLGRLLRRRRPDVLHAYGFRAGLVARLARLLRPRTRLVIGVRGLHFTEAEDPGGAKTRFAIAVERLVGWTVARYEANSRGAVDFLAGRGFDPARFTVTPNGVTIPDEVPDRSAREDGPVRIVSVSRFIPRKRHDELLRALALLRDSGVDFRCVLVGYGETEAAAKELCSELGLHGRVEFTGKLDPAGVAERLAEADLFVQNSLWEGMPGAVLEAMGAGLPVIATDVNGTNEVVVGGDTGLLVPAGDPEALAAALAELCGDRQRRAAMGAAGRARVEAEYSWERLVERKEAFYSGVAAR